MRATYKVEPSESCPGLQWIAAYDEEGKRLCKPVTYFDEWVDRILAAYRRFDALQGEERRGLLPELQYAPFVIEIVEEDIQDYVSGKICAGELARCAHDAKKCIVWVYGQIPDVEKRDFLASFDDKTPEDREAYITSVDPEWRTKGHPEFQRKPIERWITGEISGVELWDAMLKAEAARSSVTRSFPA